MLLFAICLFCAGAILSFFARFPILVASVVLVALAAAAGTAYSVLVRETAPSLPWALIVSVAALQVGYGSGAIVRGGIGSIVRARCDRTATDDARASEATDHERARPDALGAALDDAGAGRVAAESRRRPIG